MPRPQRSKIQGITHHVYSRCIEKKTLLLSHGAASMLEQVIIDTQEKYDFDLTAHQTALALSGMNDLRTR